jgi:hypothetical protein
MLYIPPHTPPPIIIIIDGGRGWKKKTERLSTTHNKEPLLHRKPEPALGELSSSGSNNGGKNKQKKIYANQAKMGGGVKGERRG